MKLADAQAVIKESQGSHLNELTIPSTGQKIASKPMSLGHHKTIAKMAIDNDSTFNKFLCALLLDLTNDGINFVDITEIDKMALVFQVKQFNSPEPLKISLECPQCATSMNVTPTMEDIIKTGIKQDFVKTMTVADITFEITIGIPSVHDSLNYSEFCDKRFNAFEDDEQRAKLALFVASYEMYLMFIKNIKMNDQTIEDYKTETVENRIKFLESLSEGLIDVQEIGQFAKEKYDEYGYHVKCVNKECGYEYDNLFSPDSFFF